jgi:hypothetical protein
MSRIRSRLYRFMTGSPVAARIVRSPRLKTVALRGAAARARVSHRFEHVGRDLADRLGLATRREIVEIRRQVRAFEQDMERLDTRTSRKGQ